MVDVSMTVGVAVTIGDGDETYIAVSRSETVMPVTPDGDAVDAVDLCRAVLTRLSGEVVSTAEDQLGSVRRLVEMAGD